VIGQHKYEETAAIFYQLWRNMMSYGSLSGRREARMVPFSMLVEGRSCIDVHQLYREGAFVGEAAIKLSVDGGCCPATYTAGKFQIGNQAIPLRWHPQLPQRLFGCPKCDRNCRNLFVGDDGLWACRTCTGLVYACRVTSPLPHLHRILSLRRAVQADPRPFAPLPVRRRKKQWQRLQEIRRLEAALLEAVRVDVAPVLESLLDERPRNYPDRAR
jgi:hypothetical protein